MTDIRSINLNHLLLLDALLTTHSVTEAARRVGLTQSGASNALAQLRLVFDDPLFQRSGRGVRPTPRALDVAPDIHAGIAALSRAVADRVFDPAGLARVFTLAMPDIVQAVVLPVLMQQLRAEAPGVRLQVKTWPQQVVPEGLARGELDLFAGYVQRVGRGLASSPLYDDTYVVLCRREHPALCDGAIELEPWLAAGHVVVSSEVDGPTGVDRALADRGLRRTIAARVENALLLPHLLVDADLVALVDRRLGARLLHPGLIQVAPPLALPRGRVRLVWADTGAPDGGLDWLRQRIHAAAGPSSTE